MLLPIKYLVFNIIFSKFNSLTCNTIIFESAMVESNNSTRVELNRIALAILIITLEYLDKNVVNNYYSILVKVIDKLLYWVKAVPGRI